MLYAKIKRVIIKEINPLISNVIKKAGTYDLLYFGASDDANERSNPKNSLINNLIKFGKELSGWEVIEKIPNGVMDSEFGEAYLCNCAEESFKHIDGVIVVNQANPHGRAFGYDKKSQLVVDRIKKRV